MAGDVLARKFTRQRLVIYTMKQHYHVNKQCSKFNKCVACRSEDISYNDGRLTCICTCDRVDLLFLQWSPMILVNFANEIR